MTGPDPHEITRDWMLHLGYQADQIAQLVEDYDHPHTDQCELASDPAIGWQCLDENGTSHHPAADKLRQTDAFVEFVLEHTEVAYYLKDGDLSRHWASIVSPAIVALQEWRKLYATDLTQETAFLDDRKRAVLEAFDLMEKQMEEEWVPAKEAATGR